MKKITLLFLITSFSFCFSQKKECTGTISSVSGKIVVIQTADAILPAKNDSCTVSKDISGTSSPLGFKLTIQSGWMGIGDALVTKSEKGKLTLAITKETTSITENGKKKPQFVVGKKVKVEWGKK